MEPQLPVIRALLLWTLASGVAYAGELKADLAAARAQIDAGEHKAALKTLAALEDELASIDGLVDQQELATLWLYRGAAEHLRGPRKDRDIEAWRQALAIDNALPWDESLVTDGDVFSLFEALRGEVRSRGSVTPGIPEATGAAKLYVDGVQLREDEPIISGTHLAQIDCPDEQGTFSVVTDFSRPLDWLALCPDGVDTSVVVEEDEWAEFGPVFGGPAEEPVAEEPAEEPAEDTIAAPPREPRGFGVGTAMMAGGGALLATGAVINFAVVNPTYAEIEAAQADPFGVSRAEADELTQRFDRSRYATIGLVGVGVALTGAGVFIDAPLRPVVGPGHLGVAGRF